MIPLKPRILSSMSEADYVWAGIIFVGAAAEAYALRNKRDDDTLSEVTRSVFRVRTTRAGRWIFGGAWVGFSAWYLGHILDWWA